MDLDILLHINLICVSYFKLLSTKIPRNFVAWILLIAWSCNIMLFVGKLTFGLDINIPTVLSTFIVKRLESDQDLKCAISSLQSDNNWFKLESQKVSVQSSANIVVENFWDIDGISFTYTKKSRGPNIEPCGTPILTILETDFAFLTDTKFWRSLK